MYEIISIHPKLVVLLHRQTGQSWRLTGDSMADYRWIELPRDKMCSVASHKHNEPEENINAN